MARTRAERRANTAKKCAARKKAATQNTEGFAQMCSGKVTPSGEACSCSLCETEKNSIWNQTDYFIRLKKKDDAWWAAQY